jgi:hypothetical protein
MSSPAASLAWARGTLARLEGKALEDCPYPFTPSGIRDQALGVIWCAAWHAATDERLPVKHRPARGPHWARRLVGKKGVGRGHGRLGPRREWDAAELMVLALCLDAGWEAGRIASVLERTPQAVSNQIDRQGRKNRQTEVAA